MRSLRTSLGLGLYGLFAAAMVLVYFYYYPLSGFVGRVWEIFLAAMFAALSAGTGRSILRWTKIDRKTGLDTEGRTVELFLWSLGIGLIPLALGLLLFGTMGFFSPRGIALLTLCWAAGGAPEWRVALDRFSQGRERNSILTEDLGWGMKALSVGALLVGTIAAFAPPTYYDSLVYHLALPLSYLQEGRIGFVPYNQYAHFPQNMEMIFAWFLSAGSDISAQLFNVLLGALTGVLLWSMGRKDGRRWDLLLYVTAPCVLLLSTETYVEMSMAFFTTLAVWGADRGVRDRNRAWFVLAGLAGGFNAGIKYTGVLTPVILTTLIVCWRGQRSLRERLIDGACLGGSAFALFFPWMIKNYFLTGGNPVFPFLPSVFPAKNVFMFAESSRAYFEVLSEYKGTSSLLVELLKMPFRLAKNAQSFGGGYDVMGDMGWALPLVLAPLTFLTVRKGRGFLLAYAVAHVSIWASMRPVLRFLFPIFPVVCLLVGEGAGVAWNEISLWSKRLVAVVVGLFLMSNGMLFYIIEDVRSPLPVALGQISRTDYLSKYLDYYPAMAFMKNNLPPDARVLFVGDQRSYYCPRRHLAPMALLPTPLRDWTNDAPDGPAFGRKLRALGFTHLFFNFKEAKRLEGYRVLDLTDHGREVFNSLLHSLTPVFSTEGTVLFVLPP